jgi:LacI family transcriptional regulator
MSRRAISIQDLARSAGVSHSTVSRALRHSPLISVEVRERIQHLAQEMGYTPNAIARSLQTQRTHTIGLVVTSIADPFFADVMRGVEEVARPAGLSVILSASHNDPEQEMLAIETLHHRRVDGILVAASRITDQHMERLRRINVPTVLINNQSEDQHEGMYSVTVDDYVGAQLAVEHLLELGHHAIGYLGVCNRPKSNQRRRAGYCDRLAAAGVAHRNTWVVSAPEVDEVHDDDLAAGQALLYSLLEAGVTAVLCYNDMVAIGVLMACREQGIVVPRDLSVVGFDDIALARYVAPSLTTIYQPKRELGHHAMQMLLDLLNERPVQSQVLSPTLVQRRSTAPLHHRDVLADADADIDIGTG